MYSETPECENQIQNIYKVKNRHIEAMKSHLWRKHLYIFSKTKFEMRKVVTNTNYI